MLTFFRVFVCGICATRMSQEFLRLQSIKSGFQIILFYFLLGEKGNKVKKGFPLVLVVSPPCPGGCNPSLW